MPAGRFSKKWWVAGGKAAEKEVLFGRVGGGVLAIGTDCRYSARKGGKKGVGARASVLGATLRSSRSKINNSDIGFFGRND